MNSVAATYSHLEKVYGHADDKYVRQYHLYSKASDEYVYADSDCKAKVKTSDLKNAFLKGAFVDIAGKLYAITSYSEASSVGTIVLLTVGTSNAATLLSLKSVAD